MRIDKKITLIAREHYYLLSAVLIYCSFLSDVNLHVPLLSVFAWVSLVPLFVYVHDRPLKNGFAASCAVGLLGFGAVYYWIGDFGQAVPFGKAVIVSLVIPAITVFFATKIVIAEYMSRKFPPLAFIIYPSVWIIIDWVQTIGTMAFPWNFWGYTQYPFLSFIQIASVVGIFGITFLIIFFNISMSQLIRSKLFNGNYRQPVFMCAIAAVIVLFSIVYGSMRLHNHPLSKNYGLRVAMVQSGFSPWDNWVENRDMYLNILKGLTEKAMHHSPDIVIWSESATLENISHSFFSGNLNYFEEEVLSLALRHRVPIITGEIGIIEDTVNMRYYPQNSMVLINNQGQVSDTYAKIHLVPFGEWFPYKELFPFAGDILRSFGSSNFVPGRSPLVFTIEDVRIAPLICYENIFHRLCRTYANAGIDLYVNITNLLWTDNPIGPMQHFYFSVFRAVENGIWFASATNSGYTALIDPYGRIISSIPLMERTYYTGDMDVSTNTKTLYRSAGDSVLYGAFAFLFFVSLAIAYRKIADYNRKS